jgi:NAD(P)-dependent dehydrogenase (short-subunit alcohol dehydrogenase family)
MQSGFEVVICGRDEASVETALRDLRAAVPNGTAWGTACDVGDATAMQALWDLAARDGRVELWINNAAINLPVVPLWEADPRRVAELIQTNLIGVALGSQIALRGMLAQGGGKLYNVEGYGAAGEHMMGVSPYGASKRAVRYLTRALAAEAKATPVVVGSFDPGVVWTDLQRALRGQSPTLVRMAPIIEALAREPHEVAPIIVRKLLSNTKSGALLRPAGMLELGLRLLTAPLHSRRARLAANNER